MNLLRIFLLILTLTGGTISFSACQDIGSPLEDFKWVLLQYGENGNLKNALPDTEISAFFSSKDKKVGGSAGVNRFGGKYTVDHLTLSVSGVTQTTLGGGEKELAQEKDFLNILQKAERFELAYGKLTIFCGQSRLIFKNTDSTVPPPEFWGDSR